MSRARGAGALNPESSYILDTVAEVQFQRGEVDGAVATAQEAIDLDPESRYLRDQLEKFQTAEGGGA